MKKISINQLSSFLTKKRINRIEEVLSKRLKNISILLEDIHQGHNVSAVLRTCDNFGIQNVYIIEDSNKITLSKNISLGSEKWVTLNIKKNTVKKRDYIKKLKKDGFKIISTVPPLNNRSISLEKLKITKKMIVCFGNEEKGLSKDILEESDYLISIPMEGFNESFNISVSCAITMNHILNEAKKRNKITRLNKKEIANLRYDWYLKSIKNSKKVIKNLRKR